MKKALQLAGIFGLTFLGAFAALQLQRLFGEPAKEPVSWRLPNTNSIHEASLESIEAPVDFRTAAKKIMPSVVSIDTVGERTNWFGETVLAPMGAGSGVVISRDGYIVTNNHVVEDATQVRVHFVSGKSADAKLIGRDPRTDLAVLKVTVPDLVPAEIGTSSKLQIGEWVLAVGNPLGYENTVSVGVVSSLGRSLQTNRGSMLLNLVQTDAAINQGNSGGALTNAQGQLVAINSAIASNTGGGSIGIGFAIPIDGARQVVNDIIKYGRAKHGMMGVETFQRPGLLSVPQVRRDLAEQTGAQPPTQGLVVRSVSPGAPAERAGMQQFDVLLSIDGNPLTEPVDLVKALLDKKPGDKVSVKYWSRGQTKTLSLTLADLIES